MSRKRLPISIDLESESALPVAVQIERHFREAITSGTLKPGQRLPSNMEIAAEIGASCTAVQKALATLTREGLMTRKPRRGTFVGEGSGTRTLLLVFGVNLMAEFAHFYRAFGRACEAEAARRGCHLRVFDLPLEDPLESRWKEFRAAARDPSVIGAALFAMDPARVRKILDKIPSVLYQPGEPGNDILLDTRDFMRRSLDFFGRTGRKKIAYVSLKFERVPYSGQDIADFLNEAAARGIESPDILPLMLPDSGREHEEKAFHRVLEVCREWHAAGKHPDGIIVFDDVIMRPISMALAKAGFDDPKKTAVVVRTIREFEYHYAIPVARYRYSVEKMASLFLERLWKKMKNPRREFPMERVTGEMEETAS